MNKHRHTHGPEYDEHRGRPLLISDAEVREMELILEARDEDYTVEIKALTWGQLGFKAGLDIVCLIDCRLYLTAMVK